MRSHIFVDGRNGTFRAADHYAKLEWRERPRMVRSKIFLLDTHDVNILHFDFAVQSFERIRFLLTIDEEYAILGISINKVLKKNRTDPRVMQGVLVITWYGWNCRGQWAFNVDMTRSLPMIPAFWTAIRHQPVRFSAAEWLAGRGRPPRMGCLTARPASWVSCKALPSVVKCRLIETIKLSRSSPPVGRRPLSGRLFLAPPRWWYFVL